ncbi:MAG: 23S rRNA pseudouridylate synthase B [Legionellales bacterium]|jgi:23S rRNA pseudouridine2605 synthase|nr:23S rRNA pseudouridylate synthase B [Legionellales bacterium]HBH10424.1 23S rRNA pseudouridylate synthase B [Gammaproteobacteria bacterium]|tara:strand:- start:1019 stop:1753 length:735 start_codon:yes stop_codon:yes gene_type:complete
MADRIQKVLANAGYGSRREIEKLINNGKIKVNGKLATIGQCIEEKDQVAINSRPIRLHQQRKKKPKVLAYYKQAGEVCTRRDEKGRETVFKNLPRLRNSRWISIGRLDLNTTGLLLFTTDGELANKLMHPSSEIEREYAVRVFGRVTNENINTLLDGVELEDGFAKFTDIVDSGGKGTNHWYHVVVMEGRNKEVRRLWESQGVQVTRLIRTRFGSYILPRKKRVGQFWRLDEKEIKSLENSIRS